MLTMLGLWTATENEVYLYILIGIVPLYIAHLVISLVRSDKGYKRKDERRSEFLALSRDENARVVYITYLGDEQHVKKPSQTKKDYLVEFYADGVDLSLLKRHLWYDLSDEDEERVLRFRIGQIEIPYPFLGEIAGRKLLIQAAFFQAAKDSPLFESLFGKNEVILYDE